MVGIAIVTHGEFGAYLLEAAEEIIGRDPMAPVFTSSISRRLPLTEVREKIEDTIRRAAKGAAGDGVLVLCDMLGGTPCNEALTVARRDEKVHVLAGVNLYMVISALLGLKRLNLESLTAKVAEDARRAVVNAKELITAGGRLEAGDGRSQGN